MFDKKNENMIKFSTWCGARGGGCRFDVSHDVLQLGHVVWRFKAVVLIVVILLRSMMLVTFNNLNENIEDMTEWEAGAVQ